LIREFITGQVEKISTIIVSEKKIFPLGLYKYFYPLKLIMKKKTGMFLKTAYRMKYLMAYSAVIRQNRSEITRKKIYRYW
jgi:hypothetical protein